MDHRDYEKKNNIYYSDAKQYPRRHDWTLKVPWKKEEKIKEISK